MAETDKLVKIILSVVNKSKKPLDEVIAKFDETVKALKLIDKKLNTSEKKVTETTTKAATSAKQFTEKLDNIIKQNITNLKKGDKRVESSGKKIVETVKISSENIIKATKKVNPAIKRTEKVIKDIDKELKKATKSTKAIGSHAKALTNTMSGSKVSLGRIRRGVEQLGDAYKNTGNSAKSFRLQLTGLESFFIGQGAAIAALIAMVQQLRNFIDAAEQSQAAIIGLASIARFAGEDIGESLQAAAKLSENGLIDVKSAALSLKNLLSKGFTLDESIKIVERLTDAAVFGRQAALSVSHAVRSATEGLKNNMSVLVDNAGVTKNLSIMHKDLAKQLGKGVKSLTAAEIRLAEFNGIMEETAGMVGNAELALKTLTGTKAQYAKAVFDLNAAIGTSLTPTFIELINVLTWSFNNVIKPFFGGIEILAVKAAMITSKMILLKDALSDLSIHKMNFKHLKGQFAELDKLVDREIKKITDKYEGISNIPELGKDTGKRRKDLDADLENTLGVYSKFSKQLRDKFEEISAAAKKAELAIRLRGIVVGGDISALIDDTKIKAAKEKLDAINEMFGKVDKVKDIEAFERLLKEKAKAENKYLEARVIKNENMQRKLERLEKAKGRVSAKLTLEAMKIEMAELGNLLKKGEIVTKEFFDKRNKLIETQFQEEIDLLDERIEKETDLIEIEELKLQRLHIEGEHRKAKIASIKEENTAYENLERTKQRLQEIPERAQQRVMRDMSGLSLFDTQLQEEELLSSRHERELQRLQDMTVAKELEADKQLAITETLVAQEMELDNLRLEHRKQLNKAELQMQSTLAGDLGSIFGDMNEVFGEETKAFFLLKQAAAIAQAIINTQLAMTDAIAKNGGPLGLAQSALLYAKGMASVAVIASQTIKGMATGGIVQGTSPNSKADNIPIMATAKEFVQPVDSVQHYGLPFMEGIRKKLIPKDIFKNFRLPSFPTPSFPKTNFADGGSVIAPNNSYSVSVPVSVNGFTDELSSRLQQGIEETVISIMREELA